MANQIRKNKDFNPNNCPVIYCMNFIGGKWKPVIIHLIRNGDNRYSIFQRKISEMSKQTLTNQLRELENDGIVERNIYAELPPRVEYKLSALGNSLIPILDSMRDWGNQQMRTDFDG